MRRFVAIAIAACTACGSGGDAPPASASAARVVAITPSATEVVAALGATASLVGVDDYSQFPREVAALPKVGSFLQPNLEAIVALRPTLVVLDDVHGQAAGALRDAHVDVVAAPMHTLPDVKSALRAVAAKLGRARDAERAIADIDRALAAAAARKPARHPRVLVVIDREADGIGGLVAAGPGSTIDELLAVVGGDNVLAYTGARYPKISVEEVLRAEPEVILDLSFAGKASIAPWQSIDVPAVAAHRVIALSDDYLLHPSPRVAEALDALARAIR